MTLRQIRLGLLLPLAFGCAHAVYDGQPDAEDTTIPIDNPSLAAGTGNNVVNGLGGSGSKPTGGAGSPGVAGLDDGPTGEAGKGTASAGASAAGASNGGAASGGAASGGAASAGAPAAGAASGGSASGGAASAGAANGGAPAGGSTGGDACSTAPTWTSKAYGPGDVVKTGGKLYKCKPFPNSGWCGTLDAYAPGTGFAWADAWDVVGSC